jgi:hypothetical protein
VVAFALVLVAGFWIGRGAPPQLQSLGVPSPAAALVWFAGCGLVLLMPIVASLRHRRLPSRETPDRTAVRVSSPLRHIKAIGILNVVAAGANFLCALIAATGLFIGASLDDEWDGHWMSLMIPASILIIPAVACGAVQGAAGVRLLLRRKGATLLGFVAAGLSVASVFALCLWPLLLGSGIYTAAVLSRKLVREALNTESQDTTGTCDCGTAGA